MNYNTFCELFLVVFPLDKQNSHVHTTKKISTLLLYHIRRNLLRQVCQHELFWQYCSDTRTHAHTHAQTHVRTHARTDTRTHTPCVRTLSGNVNHCLRSCKRSSQTVSCLLYSRSIESALTSHSKWRDSIWFDVRPLSIPVSLGKTSPAGLGM